jgi:hypothetical protein
MITGVHGVVFSKDADGVRAFLRDVLEFPSVDAGEAWLIFGLPPAELAAHPTDAAGHHELYLMCDDAHTTVAADRLRPVTRAETNPLRGQAAAALRARRERLEAASTRARSGRQGDVRP